MFRHVPKHYAETLKTACKYCHKTPALWHYVGGEKICVHCGTRVYNSSIHFTHSNRVKTVKEE
ncbi:MAG TPA: hypothetical protein VHO69_05465 [Phototrophicaceae bacterium]|jgi:hypothetical protein|nr:hypothetical protein [Phototrophicaceae bacterium]